MVPDPNLFLILFNIQCFVMGWPPTLGNVFLLLLCNSIVLPNWYDCFPALDFGLNMCGSGNKPSEMCPFVFRPTGGKQHCNPEWSGMGLTDSCLLTNHVWDGKCKLLSCFPVDVIEGFCSAVRDNTR